MALEIDVAVTLIAEIDHLGAYMNEFVEALGVMTPDERIRARALIEELTADGEYFHVAEARELIALVPRTARRRRFSFTMLGTRRRGSASGFAAGVGNVSLPQGDDPYRVSIGEAPRWRIGGYDVVHEPGLLDIQPMWAETRPLDDGQHCQLEYSGDEPIALWLWVPRPFVIPLFKVSIGIVTGTWKLWKRPRPV